MTGEAWSTAKLRRAAERCRAEPDRYPEGVAHVIANALDSAASYDPLCDDGGSGAEMSADLDAVANLIAGTVATRQAALECLQARTEGGSMSELEDAGKRWRATREAEEVARQELYAAIRRATGSEQSIADRSGTTRLTVRKALGK